MIMQTRAEPGLVIAAGSMAGLLGGVVPLNMGLGGGVVALSAALAASLATSLLAGWRFDAALLRHGMGRHGTALPEEQRLALFDAAPMALLLTDAEGRITQVNAAFRDLLGRLGGDLRRSIALPSDTHWVGGDIRQLLPDFDQQVAGQTRSMTVATGAARLAIAVGSPLDGQGRVIGIADLSGEHRLQKIIDAIHAQQLVLELASDGRILSANARASDLAGLDPAALEGRALAQLLVDAGPDLPALLEGAAQSGLATARLCWQGRGGRDQWQDCRFIALPAQDGQMRRLICLASDITETVEAEARDATARRHATEAQSHMARLLGEGLTALALGDLTHRIQSAFAPQYEPLRQNFNSAIDRLSEALGQVIGVTATIRNGAAEMSAAAEDLSRRTEGQAATLEETAAALDELTASVRSAAESAASADKSVLEAHREAEESGRVVTDAVEAMGQIENSSRQISQIIGVIDEIAFQTNLLALNAGVEAARAGEAGRGFAVVASEVRALAQRSSAAAREIKDLISSSSRQVENGVTLVGQAGETLRAIVTGVTDIAERVSALAQSSREQANGITEINSGVTMLDQVTQQNAAMVEQATAASHSLHRAAESLAGLMQRFKLESGKVVLETGLPGPSRDGKVTHLRLAEGGGAPAPRDPRPPVRAVAPAAGWEEF